MSDVIPAVTTEMLQAFAEAWNRHDVDALIHLSRWQNLVEEFLPQEPSGLWHEEGLSPSWQMHRRRPALRSLPSAAA